MNKVIYTLSTMTGIIVLLHSTTALATDGTGNIGGVMTQAITLTETRPIVFGEISIPSDTGTAIATVAPVAGTLSLNANGTDSTVLSTTGVQDGIFSITAAVGETLLFSANGIGVASNPPGIFMDTFEASYDGGGVFSINGSNTQTAVASANLNIGTNINISENAPATTYTTGQITYELTVIYQ